MFLCVVVANAQDTIVINNQLMMNKELERLDTRQRRLGNWSKALNIYGTVSAVVGTICLASALHNDHRYSSAAVYETSEQMIVGTGACVDAAAAFIVSACLRRSKKKTLKEMDAISISPTVNLMADRNTQEKGVGLGMKIVF